MNTLTVTIPVIVGSGPGIGTANVTEVEDTFVIGPGGTVHLTYTITSGDGKPVTAFLGNDVMPGGPIPLIADGQSRVFAYSPTQSGPFPICAVDVAGNMVVQPVSVIVQNVRPAIDPTAPPTKTTVQSGAYDDPVVWGGTLPGIDETCLVAAGHALTATGRLYEVGRLLIQGSLTLTAGILYATDYHVQSGGILSLNGDSTADKSLLILTTRPQHPNDTGNQWRCCFVDDGGTFIARGAVRTPFAQLAAAPQAGDTSLKLASPVTGWNVGNKIALPDSRHPSRSTMTPPQLGATEIVIVRGVSADGLTVYLLNPCKYAHPGLQCKKTGEWTYPHAAHMITTTGVVTADPTSTDRGYFKATGRAYLDIFSAVIHGGGRTQGGGGQTIASLMIGQYNVTLNGLVGPVGGIPGVAPLPNGKQPQWRIEQSVLLDPYPVVPSSTARWGICLINTSDGAFRNNVVFNWAGAGVMCLTGGEIRNDFDGNISTFINGTGQAANGSDPDVGVSGDGFYFSNYSNWWNNNVSAGCRQYGLTTFIHVNPVMVPQNPGDLPSTYVQVDPHVGPQLAPYDGDTIYGTAGGWTTWWWNSGTAQTNTPSRTMTLSNITVWNVMAEVYWGYPSDAVTVDGFLFLNNLTESVNDGSMGITFVDYLTHNFTLQNGIMEGFWIGYSGPCSGSGVLTISNVHFDCQTDIIVTTPSTGSGGLNPGGLNPRTTRIDNCTFGMGQTTIQMLYNDTNHPSFTVLDAMYVTSYQGVSGQDFQVFYPQQAPSFVMETTTFPGGGETIGQPAPGGLTNAQLAASGLTPLAGEIMPANAVNTKYPEIQGYTA